MPFFYSTLNTLAVTNFRPMLYLTLENVRETVFLTFSGVKQFKQPEMG